MATRYKTILKHFAAWLIYALVIIIFLNENDLRFRYSTQVLIGLIHVIVFYATSALVKKYLFNKKITLFIVSLLFTLVCSTAIKTQLSIKHFNERTNRTEIQKHDFRPPFHKPGEMHPDRPKRHNRMLSFDFLIILFISLVAMVICFIQKSQKDEQQKLILIKEKSNAELQFLKQQINPHFLFNSLNTIYSLANKNSQLTTDAVLKLSSILRYVIYHSHKEIVSLSNEINTIEDYIELQKLRLSSKVKLSYNTMGNADLYLIEPLLIIPILENTFKHGLNNITESFIDIFIKIEDGYVILHTRNKIIPVIQNVSDESGIGLKNIKRRLEILYPNGYELTTKEKNEIYYLYLKLKLKR